MSFECAADAYFNLVVHRTQLSKLPFRLLSRSICDWHSRCIKTMQQNELMLHRIHPCGRPQQNSYLYFRLLKLVNARSLPIYDGVNFPNRCIPAVHQPVNGEPVLTPGWRISKWIPLCHSQRNFSVIEASLFGLEQPCVSHNSPHIVPSIS